MPSLHTFLDLISLGVEVSTLRKVGAIRGQIADEAQLNEYLSHIRNEVFRYSEAFKDLLAEEPKDRKLATAGIGLLKDHLERSNLSAELFPALADKEYVADLYRRMRSSFDQMIQQLTEAEQLEVQGVISKGKHLPEYVYYLEAQPRVVEYREATQNQRQARQAGQTQFASTLTWILAALFFLTGLCGSDYIVLVWPIAVALALTALFLGGQARKHSRMAHVLKSVPQQIDLDYYSRLEQLFGENTSHVAQLRDEAQSAITSIFGESETLSRISRRSLGGKQRMKKPATMTPCLPDDNNHDETLIITP